MNRVSFGLRDDDEKLIINVKPNLIFDKEHLKLNYKRMHYLRNKEKYKQYNDKYMKQHKDYFKEYFKEYAKSWKEKNPDYFKQYRVQSVVCECGCELQRRNLAKHKTSKKHIDKFL